MKVPHATLNKPLAIGALALIALVGGTDIASAQTAPQRIKIHHSVEAREGGSNVGGSEDHFSQTDPWADGVVDTLVEQEQIAVQAFADGNTLLAIKHYKDGLEQVLQTASSTQNRLSWTYKMAERALVLANRLESASNPGSEKDLRPIVSMVQSTYEMIEKYYYSLDIQFYTPYRMACMNPNMKIQYDLAKFEDQLRSYSLKQIDWFQKKYVMSTNELGVVPRYSSKVFLISLASIAKGLSIDLGSDINNPNPSLFPTAYAQAARSLAKLSDQIEQHLAGNGIFGNDQRAVNFTYERLTQIIAYITAHEK